MSWTQRWQLTEVPQFSQASLRKTEVTLFHLCANLVFLPIFSLSRLQLLMKVGADAEVSYSAVPVDIKSSWAVLNICHGAIVSNFSSHESSVFLSLGSYCFVSTSCLSFCGSFFQVVLYICWNLSFGKLLMQKCLTTRGFSKQMIV